MSHCLPTTEAQICAQGSPSGICGGQCGSTGKAFLLKFFAFPCDCSIFIHVPTGEGGFAMALAVSRRSLTAESRIRVWVGFLVDKVALGQVFLRVLRFSRQYNSTVLPGDELYVHYWQQFQRCSLTQSKSTIYQLGAGQ
jgi:hypothetical protein